MTHEIRFRIDMLYEESDVYEERMKEILKALEDVKRKKKLIKKWEKKEKYYQKRVASLESMGENRASTRKGGEFT